MKKGFTPALNGHRKIQGVLLNHVMNREIYPGSPLSVCGSRRNARLVGGFTLIEIAVTIGITAVLTTILIVYSGSSKKQVIFFKEQALLVKSVLRAREFALEAFQPSQDPGVPSTRETICGWGFYADINSNANEYIIFRDLSVTGCSSGGNDLAYTPGGVGGKSEAFEIFAIDPAAKISCISYVKTPGDPCEDGIPPPQNKGLSVIFIPPDPQIGFDPQMPPSFTEAVVRLELADGSRKSDIRVGLNGQVNF